MLPPQIDEALIQEWKEHDKERYAALMTPESALKTSIGLLNREAKEHDKERYAALMTPESALKTSIGLLNREAYTIRRVSEEIPVYVGVDIDFAIKFPDSDSPVFVTMHGEQTEEGDTLWQIGRFVSEEIPVYVGVDIDFAIKFPDSDSPVFVTMHGEQTEEGDTLWQIGRFWSGKPRLCNQIPRFGFPCFCYDAW